MEVDNDDTTMQCFKISHKVVGNLKISCDLTNSKIVIWSKYQLFVYPKLNFKNFHKSYEPEFEIVDVIVVGNCLICLDCSGNLNLNVDTNMESLSLIWRENIKCMCACEIMNKRYIMSLQCERFRGQIWLNEISEDYLPNEGTGEQLDLPHADWIKPEEKSMIVCGHLESKYSKEVQNIFNVLESDINCLLVLITFDKRTLYAVLYPRQGVHNAWGTAPNAWLRLYKSHTDIVDFKIIMPGRNHDDISILIGLSGGNIVKIPLLLKNQKPEVYHLNTTINKFAVVENSIIYTDALALWKNENAFSQSNSSFEQFKIKNIRDFCIIKNLIVCVTFSNLIYTFDIGHRSSYLNPVKEDSCAVQLVTNSDYLKKIMETVQKNEELLRKINRESEYLMAFSLSARKDVMDELIEVKACVYNDYRDLSSKNSDLTLTDTLDAYYDSESYYFLITISINKIQHKLNKILSDVLDDLKIHITLSEHGVFKTTSIQIKEQLTTKKFVIPLKTKNLNVRRMRMHVKIITNVPGKYDENQNQYTILYQKLIELNAEHFINMKTSSNKNYTLLKDVEDTLDMLICKRAAHLHSEYKFQIPDNKSDKWSLYVLLPNCNLTLKDILGLNPLDSSIASVFKHLWKHSKDKNHLEFQVGKENVKLQIEGENMIVICSDLMVASDIRNLFSRIIYNTYKDQLSKKLVDHKYYTIIENMKRDISVCVERRKSMEEFTLLFTRFLRTVYCLIPI